MKKVGVIFLILLLAVVVSGEKAISLPDIGNPKIIAVDHELLIITGGTNIYMYAIKDFRLLKKFGKRGEGPREFLIYPNMPLRIKLLPDKFLVNSMGKISYFTRKGEYIKEIKHTVSFGAADLFPIGEQFAAMSFVRVDKKMFITGNIYDSEFKKIKEISRAELLVRGQKFKILEKAILMQTDKNRIYVTGAEDFIIDIFDYSGEKIHTVNRQYKKLKFTEAHKEEAMNFYKTNPETKSYLDLIKSNILWPDHFPAIRYLAAADRRIYVQTYLVKDGKTEFFLFDHNGKFLSRKWVPLIAVNFAETLQLYTIHDHKLYQLFDNADLEEWELFITDIK
ncbi:MAG: hypothetical protein KAT34_08745 [Candidatus Aminicenantes bacterium]|nr:hypothetical protein [Candidatus Aminicenantes bacterium]